MVILGTGNFWEGTFISELDIYKDVREIKMSESQTKAGNQKNLKISKFQNFKISKFKFKI